MNKAQFTVGQDLTIESLAEHLGLVRSQFRVEALFEGGMGVCLKVRHTETNREFALKTIRHELLPVEKSWQSFLDEMKTWLTLSACDGVVEAYCIVRINEIPFVCAEWMPGGDLSGSIENGELDFMVTNSIRIVSTLNWVWANHRIIHRDLKPSNILLNSKGLAFVGDWGIARPVARTMSEIAPSAYRSNVRLNLTQAGQFKGTIIYASPEQILGSADIDFRSDVYGFGCILYEWLTGLPPFLADSAEIIALMHLNEPVPAIPARLIGGKKLLQPIVEKCLEKSREDRYDSYSDLVAELVAIAETKNPGFEQYNASERYWMPSLGVDALGDYLASPTTKQDRGSKGFALVEFEDLQPFFKEAEALMAIGDSKNAEKIFARFFLSDFFSKLPDDPTVQYITINYAQCLINLGRAKEAISVFSCIIEAETKPADYFVNLSFAHLQISNFTEAERTAKLGLALFPGDKDLLGNLLISLTNQSKLCEAIEIADIRLQLGRDVRSVQETASLYRTIGKSMEEVDLPEAVRNLKLALTLAVEAKMLNPRFLVGRLLIPLILFDLRNYAASADEFFSLLKTQSLHAQDKHFVVEQIGRCFAMRDEYAECFQFCNDWLKAFPDHLGLRRLRAEVLADGYSIGKSEPDGTRIVESSCLEFFEDICEKTVLRKTSDLCYLGRLYEWMGHFDEAYSLLDEAESIDRDYWEVYLHRASFLWRSQKFESALEEALVAVERAPWHVMPWSILSKIYTSLGNERQAKTSLDKIEAINEQCDHLFDPHEIHQLTQA